ncbi:regulator of G-protein signaling 1 [Lampris incognitus]|uniref:regulator of G-protein signaling 1 n=1 Tax=Lampris incognitus TaxID=2546036 RepID=UPI0024B59FFC|nr:regulator of G-protein signaling 1 [Lampris incognitus]
MRRFSSEGSLLDLDFLPWRRVELKEPGYENQRASGTYTPHQDGNGPDGRPATLPPAILETGVSKAEKGELTKEHSVSVENLPEKHCLEVRVIGEGYRAYSDSQLVPAAQGSTESMGGYDQPPPSPSSSSNPFCFTSHSRHHARAKLSSAKLHLKNLFGQSPHSSHSNLFNTEQKDSAKERRSRLLFMRQWSQVGHSKGKFSKEELGKWAESLDSLLASRMGVSVFGAFLRSEFSEENLQFYLACEQYRHSSNNFSLQRRAKDICTTYIQQGAPREVNLDSKTRQLTVQLLQAPSHASLSHAQKRIYSLLDTDCYPRFLQSDIYLALLRDAD